MSRWPRVTLGKLIKPIERRVVVIPEQKYKLLGVRWYAQGLFIKEEKSGFDVRAPHLYKVESGDFVYSRLFAWKGSFANATEIEHGCYVSNEFPCFHPTNRIDPSFLLWYFSREIAWSEALGLSSGATPTSRNRLSEAKFLGMLIPLPSLEEQHSIVARMDAVADKARQVEAKLNEIEADATALVISLHHKLADGRTVQLGDILELAEDIEPVLPDIEYPQVGVRGFGGGLFAKPAIRGTDTTYRVFNRLYPDAIVLSQVKGWEGAIARCPEYLADFYVSPEYRTFRCISNQASPAYLGELIKTPWFWGLLQNATRGVGARRERTRPEQFLTIELPMPLFQDQVKGIEVVERLEKTKAKHTETRQALKALLPSMLEQIFRTHN